MRCLVLACLLAAGCARALHSDEQTARALLAAQRLAVAVDRGREAEAIFWLRTLERALVDLGLAPADVLRALRQLNPAAR